MTKHIFKATDFLSQSGGISQAIADNQRAMDLIASDGGIAQAIADSRKAIEMMSNGGIASMVELSRHAMDLIASGGGVAQVIADSRKAIAMMSNGGIASMLEQNRYAMDLIASGGGVAQAIADSQRAIEMMSNGGIASMLEQNRHAMDLIASDGGVAKYLIENKKSINGVLERLTEQGWYESAVAIVEDELKDDGLLPEKEVSADMFSSELESLSKTDSSESFLRLFAKLPIYIQLVLLFSISQVILPQINSISANLITPYVERLVSNEGLSSREKVKKIENISLTEGAYELEGLRFISGDKVRLRMKPNTKSEIIDILDIGRVVVLLQKERRWTEIQVQYGEGTVEEGWVHSRYVRKFK